MRLRFRTIMIGIIGFLVGAMAIALFAATAYRAYVFADSRKLRLFCTAFGLLAAAMVIWALTVAESDNVMAVTRLLFCSDVLLMAGTVAMASIFTAQFNIVLTVCLSIVGSALLATRAFVYPPTGYIQNGLLYFNLTGSVRLVLLLVFVAIWLPAMVYMSFSVGRDPLLRGMGTGLTMTFVTLVFATALFLAARRSQVIIALFICIALLFIIVAVINILILYAHRKEQTGKKVIYHATAK
jgi:hypothetical protein